MSRELATIQKIKSLEPIEGADFIEKAQILGWTCVVRKGDFTVDAPCVFFEIDSVLPQDNPAFDFMSKSNYRVRTMKLKGVLSQGLAFPTTILPPFMLQTIFEGQNLTEFLKVVEYEPPAKQDTASKQARVSKALERD